MQNTKHVTPEKDHHVVLRDYFADRGPSGHLGLCLLLEAGLPRRLLPPHGQDRPLGAEEAMQEGHTQRAGKEKMVTLMDVSSSSGKSSS